ncbi:MAG: ComEC family competence protein [Bacteroidia bacterium]|nr:ComEC family competence protein [Bacteroidia bacterium]
MQRHIPLLKILIPFIGGILLCSFFPNLNLQFGLLFGILLFFVVIGHYYLKKQINSKLQLVVSLSLLFLVFSLGYLISYYKTPINSTMHFSKLDHSANALVKIVSNPSLKPKSVSCEVKYLALWDSTRKQNCIGKAQLYFQKDSLSQRLKYGDLIVVNNEIKPIAAPENPHQFDFQKFYASKGIYHSSYVKPFSWISSNTNKANWIYKASYIIQDKLKVKFKRHFKDENIRGVAEAIVFGYKGELDDNWLEAFSKTGTIHVLAVSGLHVGIIYILIAFLLGLSKSRRKYIALKTFTVLLVLFVYCLITGFSPSVSRASLMFGLVLLANLWQRQSNIYNTLCFAALVLLVINPSNIYNVGFQFSFLAVLGIVFYKDYFRKALPTSNFVLKKIVVLGAVSVAAQIATFPLGLYYFHQYPNLFIFSNLIVIPCIGIILYAGIFFVLFSFVFPPVAGLLAKLISAYIQFISSAVLSIQEVPYAFFEDIHISFEQLMLVYLFIISLTFDLVKRNKYSFVIPILCCILFLWSDYSIENQKGKKEVIYFNIPNELLVGFRENDSILFLASKGVYEKHNNFNYILRPYLVNERLINNYDILPLEVTRLKSDLKLVTTYGNGSIWFNNKSYLAADYLEDYITDSLAVKSLIIGQKKSPQFYKAIKRIVQADTVIK